MNTISELLQTSVEKADYERQKETEASLFETMFLSSLLERQKLLDPKKFSPKTQVKKS